MNDKVTVPIYDYDAINERLAGDQELLNEVCEKFISSSKEALQSFNVAVKAEQYTTAKNLIHSLKGSSATVGCMQFNEIAIKIEVELKNKNYDNLPELMHELNLCFLFAKKGIQKKLEL